MLAAIKIAFLASLVVHPADAPSTPAVAVSSTASPAAAPPEKPVMVRPLAEKDSRMADAALAGGRMALNFLAVLERPSPDPQTVLADASARAALAAPRLLGASVACAADLPPVPPVSPPPPSVRPMESPVAPERVIRPDEMTPQAPPAPEVAPFVSRDSAAQKQAELNRREQELLALQQQMEARMAELHSLENRLQGMLQDANTTQDGKFKQLVDMYANMKPRQAAQALTSVDETIAVRILTGMKSKQSGEILSYMDPQHAARLSEVMSKMQM